MRYGIALAGALVLAGTSARADTLDDIFKPFARADSPGCAVGVARAGQPTVFRGYGSADLEHAVPITPDTVFEAGSVSKQFTAAAILALAADGKLALGDDIRRHLPEMPVYASPITVDMLLSHTSGLRDWGEVAGVAGWPRGSRISTHQEVLQIAARQKGLNYPPGTAYSYTNTGYNLAAIIVQRVSGQSLTDLTRDRFFKPLGMTRTGWRDDFRRIVPGRAQAYSPVAGGWTLDMPFENVFGNSSLLTTVGDLLIWNQALTDGKLGVVGQQLETRAVLKDGSTISYARGLIVSQHRGANEIAHGGVTAGYRAWLARYPSQNVGVALLCNAGNVDSADTGRRVMLADLSPPPTVQPVSTSVPPTDLKRMPGLWVGEGAFSVIRLAAEGGTLRFEGGPQLFRRPDGEFSTASGLTTFRLRPDGVLQRHTEDGVSAFRRETAGWTPTPAELAAIAGTYVSDEADATLQVVAKAGMLFIQPADRPSVIEPMRPLFKDGFTRPGGLMRIQRDKAGKVTGFRYQGGRVWDLRFRRVG